jgi:hypothetical protein
LPEYLDLADYLLIAEAVLRVPAETIARRPGIGLAESALHGPAMGFGGVEFYPDVIETPRSSACGWPGITRSRMATSGSRTWRCRSSWCGIGSTVTKRHFRHLPAARSRRLRRELHSLVAPPSAAGQAADAARVLGERREQQAREPLRGPALGESDPYLAAEALESVLAIGGVAAHRELLERTAGRARRRARPGGREGHGLIQDRGFAR